ncbi:MFS transporter [Streptosporangium sp. NBC_01469]|uniref:MFS transporter n=1 Tax=Streptosporangium sp. NBC_01469 TaxID=2903898 RepID=UPI002E2BB823|nr:MFS transporter [Streptosporangium sp. NBC_01469]
MPQVLRRSRFRLVYFGMAVSLLGDASLLLVPGILAKSLTGSDAAAGLTLFFFTLPLCFSPFFGYLIDRVDRRKLLIVTCVLSGISLAPLIAVTGQDRVWLVYPVSAAMGCSYAVIFSALGGLLKAILPEHLLAEANGALHTTRQGLRLFGPLLGVAVYTGFGLGALVLFDMVTFLVAAGVFAMLPVPEPVPAVSPAPSGRRREEFWAGVRHLSADPPLRRAAVALCLMFSLAGATESLIFAVIEHGLARSPEFTAFTSTAMGLGAIAGGLWSPTVIARRGELFAIGAGVGLYGVAVICWMVPAEAAVLGAMAVAGAGLTLEGVARTTLVQRRSPGHLVGRVSTAFESLTGVAQLLSLLGGAVLVSLVDYRLLLAVVGLTACCAGAYALRGGGSRWERPPAGNRSSCDTDLSPQAPSN